MTTIDTRKQTKTVHVISHTHWDREWYMPFEKFRLRLVDLFDKTIELLETEGNGFEHFHADGHVLLVDDYLEIRPERRERLERLVREGKLHIGPWYVLQDAFLTSGEAQVRNMLYGIARANELGGWTRIGYYPDTFGNISQSAQLLRGFGIETAVFGRGVNAVAENNTVVQGESRGTGSELWWESSDGSRVLGVLLANWYHNGMELPVGTLEAKARAEQTLPYVEKFASTRHLLLMNGCDHQPVQADVGEAIRTLNGAAAAYRFEHSHFERYTEALRASGGAGWATVRGELIGRQTDGWTTLVNTASARLYLKQWNARAQRELERWAEPFSAIAWRLGRTHPEAFIGYGWKMLLQNHAHDSICGCSVDEVHEEMVVRFRKTLQVAESLSEQALGYIAGCVDTMAIAFAGAEDASIALIAFNPTGSARTDAVEATVLVAEALRLEEWELVDGSGRAISFQSEYEGIRHGFTLPDDKFRIVWQKHAYRVCFVAEDVPGFGYAAYAMRPRARSGEEGAIQAEESTAQENGTSVVLEAAGAVLANGHLTVHVREDGRLDVTDETTGHTFRDLLAFEDVGDIGNEYTFIEAEDAAPLTSVGGRAFAFEERCRGVVGKLIYRVRLKVPVAREGKCRSVETTDLTLTVALSLAVGGRRLEVEVTGDNQANDHRLRALFPTGLAARTIAADAPFDVVEREIAPAKGWTNPSACERMQTFVDLSANGIGLAIAAEGLPEYEALRDGQGTIALTLLRCVGELGDWNYFPTPGAQCRGGFATRFAIVPHAGTYVEALGEVRRFVAPLRAVQTDVHAGELPPRAGWAEALDDTGAIEVTSLRKTEGEASLQMRLVNLGGAASPVRLTGRLFEAAAAAEECRLDGQAIGPLRLEESGISLTVPAKRIVTVKLT